MAAALSMVEKKTCFLSYVEQHPFVSRVCLACYLPFRLLDDSIVRIAIAILDTLATLVQGKFPYPCKRIFSTPLMLAIDLLALFCPHSMCRARYALENAGW